MALFVAYPQFNRYRALQLQTPQLTGEDVYALQTALNALGHPCGAADGVLGPLTAGAIKNAQRALTVTPADGIAGPVTQRAFCKKLAHSASLIQAVPYELLCGQIEHESSYRVGNYSEQRPDGSYDAGATQRNTEHTPPREAFDVEGSIKKLASLQRQRYNLFTGISATRRRWQLAAGSWNAPAFAAYIAREEGAAGVTGGMTAKPTPLQRSTLEEYMTAASIYLP